MKNIGARSCLSVISVGRLLVTLYTFFTRIPSSETFDVLGFQTPLLSLVLAMFSDSGYLVISSLVVLLLLLSNLLLVLLLMWFSKPKINNFAIVAQVFFAFETVLSVIFLCINISYLLTLLLNIICYVCLVKIKNENKPLPIDTIDATKISMYTR